MQREKETKKRRKTKCVYCLLKETELKGRYGESDKITMRLLSSLSTRVQGASPVFASFLSPVPSSPRFSLGKDNPKAVQRSPEDRRVAGVSG